MGWAGFRSQDRPEPSLRFPWQRGRFRGDLRPGAGQGTLLWQRAIPPHRRPDLHPPGRARLLLRGPSRPPTGSHDRARDGELRRVGDFTVGRVPMDVARGVFGVVIIFGAMVILLTLLNRRDRRASWLRYTVLDELALPELRGHVGVQIHCAVLSRRRAVIV